MMEPSRRPFRAVPRGAWRQRGARRNGPPRNGLRRGSGRAESAILAALLWAFLGGVLVLAPAATRSTYEAGLRAERMPAGRHQVTAVLTEDAVRPRPPFLENRPPTKVLVAAAWQDAGTTRTGQVWVPVGRQAGSTVRIWVNGTGGRVAAPQTRTQTRWFTALTGTGCVLGLTLLWWLSRRLVRRAFLRRQLAAWEAEWAVVGPEWTGHR